MSDDFVPDSQFQPDNVAAAAPAAAAPVSRSPDFIPDAQFQSDEDKYGGLKGEALAGLAGIARGASLGTSDLALTKSGLVSPETLRGLSETDPASSIAGNVIGAGGVIAATGGLAAPLEGAAMAGGIGQVAARAIGYGAEGAVFGAGNAISDYSMQDSPSLNAQKLLADIGVGAVFGAALGAGSAKVSSYLAGRIENVASEANAAAETKAALSGQNAGANESSLSGAGGNTPADSGKLFSGLNSQKANAADIISAGEKYGVPVTPAMTSDSPWMQKAADALINGAPTFAGVEEQKTYKTIFDKSSALLEDALDTGNEYGGGGLTKATLGDAVKSSLVNKIQQESAPINAMYEALKPHMEVIPVAEGAAKDVASEISKLQEVRIDPRAPAAQLANRISGALENLNSVDDLKYLKSSIGQSISPVASGSEKHMAGVLSDMLGDLEEKSILKAATSPELPEDMQTLMKGLIEDRKTADAAYKPFKQNLKSLLEQLGRKNIGGAQSAMAHIQDLDPEDIANKLFDKKYSGFNDFLAKKYPEESALLRQYQKQILAEKATIGGQFSPQKLFTALEPKNMQPEIVNQIFHADELEKINASKTLIQSLPKNFNPSGTSGMSAFRAFMESPTGAALANVRDYGIKAFMHAMDVGSTEVKGNPYVVGAELADKFNKFSAMEKIAGEVDEKVNSGISGIFSAKDGIRGAAIKGASLGANLFDFKKAKDSVDNMAQNPSGGMDHMVAQTGSLDRTMPNVVQGIHSTAINAAQFLNSKLPKPATNMPLSAKYEPSDAEKSKFLRYYNAVNDPVSVLADIRHGALSNESMEALQAVHPDLLADMRKKLAGELSSKKEAAYPAAVKLAIGKFMGSPMSPSMTPAAIMANQASLNGPQLGSQQAPKMSQRRGTMKALNISELSATRTRRGEPGDE